MLIRDRRFWHCPDHASSRKHAAANEAGHHLLPKPLCSNGFIGTGSRPPSLLGSPNGAWMVFAVPLQARHRYHDRLMNLSNNHP